jgi:UDP-N-acetylmuramoyl-L-alanyl-D-glutamate--2,6-diaminopimelate ligase
VVDDPRFALAALSASCYGHPSRELTVVGITGTNGKTTTTYLLSALFERAGVPCGRIGTVGYRLGPAPPPRPTAEGGSDTAVTPEEQDAVRTTPESRDLQQMLRKMVDRGCGACVMEVSSHALALQRVEQVRFAAAVFTNLTRDHLDFHGDMESYFRTKRRLFEMLPHGAPGVVNVDDPRGQALAAAIDRPVTYAIDRDADVRPEELTPSLDGLTFKARTPRGAVQVRSRLLGRPNTYNILAAVATASALELPLDAIEDALAEFDTVPGRFQVVSTREDDFTVLVDYAHTDDALKNLLETARPLAAGRLITVFGCGGDRDRTKRPLMGAVAARLSDVVIVTSDNPRSEDPASIIDEVSRGLSTGRMPGRPFEYRLIVDRGEAIEQAIRLARAGDLVVLAGKGHEKYQVIGDRVLPFDDVDVARAALAKRRARGRV